MNPGQPRGADLEPVEWVILKHCAPTEVSVLQLHLDAAGIESFTTSENITQAGDTPVVLHVPLARLDTAQQIVASLNSAEQFPAPKSDEEIAKLPLSWGVRTVAFLLPIVAGLSWVTLFIARANYLKRGCKRKANEWVFWHLGGFIFWFAVLLISQWLASSPSEARQQNLVVPPPPAIILTSPPSATGL